MSSRASRVSREDCAMDMMEEDACKRSRYRSLRFHIRVSRKLRSAVNGYAPDHEP
jgi:hypothetical protein